MFTSIRRFIGLLTLVGCSLFMTVSALAQNPGACTPDCPQTPFGASSFVVLTLPGGCQVLVEYATRNACHIWWDVAIVKVTPLNLACTGLPLTQLINDATTELLLQNPMGFPPLPGQPCATNWRVIKGACWRYDINPCNQTTAIPCGNACCLQPYTVCVDALGNRTITAGPATPTGPCDPSPGCEFVCNGGPDVGSTLFIGTDGEMKRSNDNGIHWEILRTAPSAEPARVSVKGSKPLSVRVKPESASSTAGTNAEK